MNKPIKTYEDLLEEEQRLISRLRYQEEVLKKDMVGIREGLKPFNNAMKVVNKMATRDNTAPVLNFGLEMGIDLLVRRVLLAKAGWFAKIVVPFVIKNYSSHIIGEEKREKLMQRLRGFFNAVRPQQEPVPPHGDTDGSAAVPPQPAPEQPGTGYAPA